MDERLEEIDFLKLQVLSLKAELAAKDHQAFANDLYRKYSRPSEALTIRMDGTLLRTPPLTPPPEPTP